MKPVNESTILVYDRGLFPSFARVLAREFKKVYYYVPNDSPFPTPNLSVLGDGYPDIERVRELNEVSVDGYAFPDVGNYHTQRHCRELGYPVWGSGAASDLELKRLYFKKIQAKLGMEVPKYDPVIGIKNLRNHLEGVKEAYLKISTYRGLMETYHHHDLEKTHRFLDHLAVLLGPLQDNLTFLVEHPIEAVVETGLDAFCVASQFPSVAVQGIEAKDKSYCGAVTPWDELPQHLTDLASALKPELKDYANFFSAEVRITKDDKAYLTDPTMRHATPAGECLLELIENLADIVWAGAHGEFVEPAYKAKFAMQALVDSPDDDQFWREFTLDPSLDEWFMPYNAVRIDDKLAFPPLPWSCETIGSVVAIGDTLDECLKTLKERAAMLEKAGLEVHLSSLTDVFHSIEKEEQAGVPFTEEEVPEPAEVLEPNPA